MNALPLLAASLSLVMLSATAAGPARAEDEFNDETRVGMSEADFSRANTELFGKGFRLVDVTVTESKGTPVVGAIWYRYKGMPAGTPERTKQQVGRVFLKLDEAALRAMAQKMGAEGSAIEVIDAYQAGGKTWFATSFSPPKEPTMQTVGALLTNDETSGMREEAQKHDNDFLRMDAFADGDKPKFLPVFVGRGKAEIDIGLYTNTLSLSADGVSKYVQGYQPLSITVFDLKGQTYWVALWDKGPDRDFMLTESADKIRQRIASGGHILDLDSQAGHDGAVSYYAVAMGGKKDD